MPFWKQEHFSTALLTDLYQLTMACAYWKSGMFSKEAVFQMIFRKNPFGGGFSIACGLENLVHLIETFAFSESDIEYLSRLTGSDSKAIFPSEFLTYLKNLKFTCDLEAIPEGTVVFPIETRVRMT